MKITKLDSGGIYLKAEKEIERIQAFSFEKSDGSITLTVWLNSSYSTNIDSLIQYLTPFEAMSLANALEALAVAALKESAW